MQVSDFSTTLRTIVDDLSFLEVDKWLEEIFAEGNRVIQPTVKDRFEKLLFQMSNNAARLQQVPGYSVMFQILGLDRVTNANNLAALITQVRNTGDTNNLILAGPERRRIWEFFYAIRSTLRLAEAVSRILVTPRLEGISEDKQLVYLDVVDYDGTGIPLSRFLRILEALNELTDALSLASGEAPDVRVGFADSGSDLGLGLLVKKAMAHALEGLFKDGIDRIRFWKNDKLDRNIQTLRGGLSFLDDLNEGIRKGTIEPEAAARIQHGVLAGMNSLLSNGVKLHEESTVQVLNDREVLSAVRDAKLLPPGKPAEEGSDAK